MKTLISSLGLLMVVPLLTFAQFNISGDLTPSGMLRISDASLIDLPFRLGNISVDYAYEDFELKSVTALETRWKDPEINGDMLILREAYLM